jgi:hypothetical protein
MKIMKNVFIIGLMCVHLSTQTMLTQRARQAGAYKRVKGAGGIFSQPSTNSFVNITSSGPFGPQGQIRSYSEGWKSGEEPYFAPEFNDWKDYAKPFKRSLTSYIPFTQAYAHYQKKNQDLAQLRYMVDKWQVLICQKYDTPQNTEAALNELRKDMESFKLKNVSNYKKEVLIYTVALLNHCLTWREENKIIDNDGLLELLFRYINHIADSWFSSDLSQIKSEYPFIHTTEMRVRKFAAEKNEQEYQQQRQYQEQQYRQRQQQGQQQARQEQSSFVKGLQTKKILGLPENASDSQVKAARNKFLLENHPDIANNLVKQGKMTKTEKKRREDEVVKLNLAYAHEYEGSRE